MKQGTAKGDKNEGKLIGLLHRLKHVLSLFFEPEEVEVTFTRKGNHTSYTYTRVEH